jgi:hypothetical protein
MPRKVAEPKKKKAPLPQPPETEQQHVIVQLPIQNERIENILAEMLNPLEYCHSIIDPEPYFPNNNFISNNDDVVSDKKDVVKKIESDTKTTVFETPKNCCFWCCHSISSKEFGLPIKYDTIHDSFTTFGSFCSLECTVAYNYSYYMGSDRMWEIHSWIQWMSHKMGFETPIRPAPSRYLLKMFNGPMEITEFRQVHKNYLKTYIMNMPPLIHVQGQMESINTSYLNQKINTLTSQTTPQQATNEDRVKLSRNKAIVDTKKTLDTKMNLIIKTVC